MTRSSFEIARQIGMTAEKRVDPADALPQPLRKDFLTAMAALNKAKTPEGSREGARVRLRCSRKNLGTP